jgi:hypothetical protein
VFYSKFSLESCAARGAILRFAQFSEPVQQNEIIGSPKAENSKDDLGSFRAATPLMWARSFRLYSPVIWLQFEINADFRQTSAPATKRFEIPPIIERPVTLQYLQGHVNLSDEFRR